MADIEDIMRRITAGGFHHLLGNRMVAWERDRIVIELEVQPKLLNLGGVVHGGVYATLIDSAAGFSGCYCPHPGRIRKAMTLSLTTSFTGAVTAGKLTAIGQRKAGGRRIYSATAEIFDDQGNLVAHGQGTFRYSRGSETEEGVAVE